MGMIDIYWILLIISGVYLLSSLMGLDGGEAGDGDLDGDGDGDGEVKIFSLRVLAGGFMGFAIGGGAMYYNGHDIGIQILTGSLVALGFGVLTFYVAKFVYGMQGNSNFSMANLGGMEGFISIGTTDNGTAQVRLETSDGARSYICTSLDKRVKLKTGDLVQIAEQIGTQLVVKRLRKSE